MGYNVANVNTDDTARRRLLDAAVTLLGEAPTHEPTTRELCARAGVTAPSLYHHFGDKDGLLAAVLEEAFTAYLGRKRAVARSGDLVGDFAAGWDMHVRFGLDNPLLYPALFASSHPQGVRVTRRAAEELALDLAEMAEAGILRIAVDDAVSLTLAASTGCVLQLLREGGGVDSPVSALMRDALLRQMCGTTDGPGGHDDPVRALLAHLPDVEATLGREEAALLRVWLSRLAGG